MRTLSSHDNLLTLANFRRLTCTQLGDVDGNATVGALHNDSQTGAVWSIGTNETDDGGNPATGEADGTGRALDLVAPRPRYPHLEPVE